MAKKHEDPFVAIGASLGGILLVMVIIVVLFANHMLGTLVPIAFALALLGIMLGYFAYKKK